MSNITDLELPNDRQKDDSMVKFQKLVDPLMQSANDWPSNSVSSTYFHRILPKAVPALLTLSLIIETHAQSVATQRQISCLQSKISPGKRQSKGSSPTSPYKRSSPSKPSRSVISSHPMLTHTRARHHVELPLTPPSALLPPIAASTARILGIVGSHHGNMESIENVVSESHEELDQWARQEIDSRDKQIDEERRLAESNKIKLSEQKDVQIHELKLHYEGKELALMNKLEKCQTQLAVLRRRIQESMSTQEIEHRCPICIDLAWNPYVAGIVRKPTPSLTIRQGVQSIADARGVVHPPLYNLRWPVQAFWPPRS
ncbi:hypothetical protein C8R41DRAFT_871367 [Lentinula lateritia]|uniref:Uncharacterized protein n=1 Tax=Lentinula lateritia TaxID=40482 RepID=A0ABQ8V1A5_9AGAR|nr:hypothetical protein C8R41DRAFT_871367 [Lentinula lateritia]